jgi:hypothetical protein
MNGLQGDRLWRIAEPSDAPNAAIALRFHSGSDRRGLGDPFRYAKVGL